MSSLAQSSPTHQSFSSLPSPSYSGSPAHHTDKEDKDILLVEGKNSCHRIDLSGSSEDSGRDTIQVDDDSGDEDDLIWALIADDLNSDASTHDIEDRNEEAQEALFEQLIRRTEAMRNPATQTASLQTQFEVSDDDENDFVIDEPYSESLIEDGIQVSDEGRCVRSQTFQKQDLSSPYRENALKFLQSIVLSFLEQISTSLGTIFSHETSKVHKKELKGLKRRKIYAAEAEQKKETDQCLETGKIGVTISLKNRKSG